MKGLIESEKYYVHVYVLTHDPQIPRIYMYVLKEVNVYFFGLLTVFLCGCLEESGKE